MKTARVQEVPQKWPEIMRWIAAGQAVEHGRVGGAGRRVVTYLDTSCFVKLYYPESDSPQAIALIQGKALCYTPLHELRR